MIKLTEQQLFNMRAAYWGCKILDNGIQQDNSIKLSFQATFEENLEKSGVIILLTPLSAITDEDAIEVAKIIYGDEFPKSSWIINSQNAPVFMCLENTDDDDYSIVFSEDGIEAFLPNNQHMKMIVASDYLRSKGYDCGYLHISSLIAAGYAVDKTKQ